MKLFRPATKSGAFTLFFVIIQPIFLVAYPGLLTKLTILKVVEVAGRGRLSSTGFLKLADQAPRSKYSTSVTREKSLC